MAKVTSKLQVTVPKAIADQYGIRPGDEIEWVPAGDGIRVMPAGRQGRAADVQWRVKVFDAATERQRLRQSGRPRRHARGGRGWTREDLYDHARPR
jgi:AbrB family looped-hinge helix DNA binding protein